MSTSNYAFMTETEATLSFIRSRIVETLILKLSFLIQHWYLSNTIGQVPMEETKDSLKHRMIVCAIHKYLSSAT